MSRRTVAIVQQLETLAGLMTIMKVVHDHGEFRAAAMFAGAVIASEWTVDDGAQDCIREWFTARDGDSMVTVQCLRAPTVVDWTIKNEKKQKAVG